MAILKIFLLSYVFVLSWARSLIDVEIEHTEELMNLYNNKSSILRQIYDLKKEYNKLDPQLIETKQFEQALKRYEKEKWDMDFPSPEILESVWATYGLGGIVILAILFLVWKRLPHGLRKRLLEVLKNGLKTRWYFLYQKSNGSWQGN